MSLYLAHFGLKEPPFRITPHTDFFFTGANRGPTLEALVYAVTDDEGIVKVTGEVGSGKTMLCRMLLERLPATVETVYLANPSLSRSEILAAIAEELGIAVDGQNNHALTRALQTALVERYAAGKRVVVLIDEAHAMPAESLEEIRLLSNLESRRNKLLQITLFAQPELDERLAASDMRQLRERITQHFSLAPLAPGDVGAYLEFRLRAAGYCGPNPFDPAAVAVIARASEGLSRRINILADKALLAAYSSGSHRVGRSEARTAVDDARFAPIVPGQGKAAAFGWAAAGAGLTAAVGGLLFTLGAFGRPASPPAAPPPAPATAAPATVTPPQAAVASAQTAQPPAGPLVERYLAAFAQWLPTAQQRHYFLQLLATDAANAAAAEDFLRRHAAFLDSGQLRAYRSSASGRDRIGVIYGEFASREAAAAALAELPEAVRALQPYPRQVSRLQ